jgi:hypothetical protein
MWCKFHVHNIFTLRYLLLQADTGVDEYSCFFSNDDGSVVARSSYSAPTLISQSARLFNISTIRTAGMVKRDMVVIVLGVSSASLTIPHISITLDMREVLNLPFLIWRILQPEVLDSKLIWRTF